MAGRFEFESPGATATATITKLLSERKAEERQRLLDSLQFSADSRAQEAAALNKRQTEAQMHSQQQQDELAKVAAMSGTLEEGEDPTGRFAPEDVQLGKKYGMWKTMPTAGVSTDITSMTGEDQQPTEGALPTEPSAPPTPPPAPKLGYVGNPKQREHTREQVQTATMIAGMLQSDDPQQKQIGSYLQKIAQANDNVVPPDFLKALPYGIPAVEFDEPNNRVVPVNVPGQPPGTISSNTHVFTRPHPPASYANVTDWKPTGKTDNEGHPLVVNKRGEMKPVNDVTVQGGSDETLGIPTRYTDELQMNLRMLAADEMGKVDPGKMLAYRTSALHAIAASKASGLVKQIADEYVANPDAAKQHAAQVRAQLTPADVADLQQIMQVVGPGQVATILRRNPQQEFKDKPTQPWYSHLFGGGGQ